jgi:hypothetical protein
MIKTFTIETGQKLTEEQLAEINEAKKYPIVFDDDCPELSPAMMKAFKCAAVQRRQKSRMTQL